MPSATAPAPSTASSTTASADGWPGGFGLYVHWPYCLSKCPYCDFNSHVAEHVDHERWRKGLLTELRHAASQAPGRRLDSIFFGGGTPSLMDPATTAAVIAEATALWQPAENIEITLEANPGTIDAARFADFRAAGVNRLSLGVQSFDDAELKFLGRAHDAATAMRGIELAARLFDRFSFDLIYARPGQSVENWRAELDRALGFGPGHISVYQLTIEPGTQFHTRHARGEIVLPEDEIGAAMFEATAEVLEAAGLPGYEISNHARPGEECRHNLIYWRGGDYAGIGPGAHGRLTFGGAVHAERRHRAPAIWLERVEQDGHATVESTAVDAATRIEELVMTGLRLTGGIEAGLFQTLTGKALADALDATRLDALREEGLVETDKAGIRATAEGRIRLNAVIGYLLG